MPEAPNKVLHSCSHSCTHNVLRSFCHHIFAGVKPPHTLNDILSRSGLAAWQFISQATRRFCSANAELQALPHTTPSNNALQQRHWTNTTLTCNTVQAASKHFSLPQHTFSLHADHYRLSPSTGHATTCFAQFGHDHLLHGMLLNNYCCSATRPMFLVRPSGMLNRTAGLSAPPCSWSTM